MLLLSYPQIPKSSNPYILRFPEVCQCQLDVGLTIVLVLLQRERDVERSLVLGEEIVAFGGTPGHGAEDAAILPQRHLEMAFLQPARTVDDLHPPRREHGPGIAGAKRGQRRKSRRHV